MAAALFDRTGQALGCCRPAYFSGVLDLAARLWRSEPWLQATDHDFTCTSLYGI
jgi:hypothetical protein